MMKTNREKLNELNSENFWKSVSEACKNPFSAYIDYPAWLDSDDSEINHFIKNNGMAMMLPSETEIISFCNEKRLEANREPTEEEKQEYVEFHTRPVMLLEKTSMYGKPYYRVADLENNSIMAVPINNLKGSNV